MQLQKQARKQATRGNPVRTHVVKVKDFNPVVPQHIEIVHATLHHNGRHVVITSQPRAT